MNRVLIVLIMLLSALSSCKTVKMATVNSTSESEKISAEDETAAHVWDFRDATTWLLGDIKPEWLLQEPHGEWYSKGYTDYTPDPGSLDELLKMQNDSITITVVLGTWCPDSRREVPRFMKIMDIWGFPTEKIRFIGVDIDKAAPLDDFRNLGIQRVPTFIFYKNNMELGRIIEVPVTSLEQDMVKILKNN